MKKAPAKRVTLVHNTNAGWGKLSQKELMRGLERGGHEVRVVEPGDGLGRELRKPADVVIAAGGDGTIASVARRLVHTEVPLIMMPLGTANNVSRTVGMKPTVKCVLETLAAPREQTFDMGVAAGSWGERLFTESAGVGWFGDALRDQVAKGKKTPKKALKVLADYLETYEPLHWRVRLDGEDFSGKYLLIDVMNAQLMGPNVALAPKASPFDGHFEVVLVTENEREKLVAYLRALRRDESMKPPRLPTRRAKHVQLELGGTRHLRVDDAVRPDDDEQPSHFADVHVLEGAVRLWLPS